MIKQTFYNLSDNKKLDLINIAKKEFACHPIYKATVSNIVNEYGIARSSFYNYFDNLEDLFYYILDEYKNKISNELKNNLNENNGDIFLTFITTFNYIIDNINEGIIKNVFINSNSSVQNFILPSPETNEFITEMKILIQNINKKKFKMKDEEDLFLLMEILIDTMIQNLIHFFMQNLSKNVIKEKFKEKINIIKYGICKEEKQYVKNV